MKVLEVFTNWTLTSAFTFITQEEMGVNPPQVDNVDMK